MIQVIELSLVLGAERNVFAIVKNLTMYMVWGAQLKGRHASYPKKPH